ncbi:MAG: MarR family winged helix-turn-helix transcriptional regulator [Candidatus Saccharimonadales bacterium]
MAETRKRYSLNQKQLHILMLLYKFRFITIPLLTTYKNLKSNSLQRTFDILLEENYIDRRFDVSYKIDRKPAIYYLAAKGVAALKADPRFNPVTLHSYYKNRSVTDVFMQHAVDTLEVYNNLKHSYEDRFEIFTRQEVAHFDDFPETKPDLYLRGDREYFLTLAYDTQLFLVRKRLAEYITHFDEDGWAKGRYPALLFIFADSNSERRFLEFANTSLESAGIDTDELSIGTTTMRALRGIPAISAIWSFTGDSHTLKQLAA